MADDEIDVGAPLDVDMDDGEWLSNHPSSGTAEDLFVTGNEQTQQ